MSEHVPSSQAGATSPEGIPAPKTPVPDIVVPSINQPTYRNPSETGNKSRHPLDPHPPLKKKNGCSGCCGCLGALTLISILSVIGLAVAIGYFGPGRYLSQGYTVVNLMDQPSSTIVAAPSVNTFYIGNIVHYEAPETTVGVAILGQEVTIRGIFRDQVSLMGSKVTGESGARFDKDLEIFAAEFTDQGVTVTGSVKGKVIRSLPLK